MEESPEPTEALAGKIHDLLTESDNETAQFCFAEEMIEEVMRQFYNEIAPSPPEKQVPPPSSVFPLLTDEGKNGSCGASVSDSTSTVMAGIEAAGSVRMLPAEKLEAKTEMEVGSEELELDLDDEWLSRVLSWEQGQQAESRQRF